jgi:SnoaL-like domain
MDSFSHALFSGFIGSVAVDDDTATGRYYTVEELWLKTGSVQRLQGRYADEMVRRDGRWLFKSRSYTVVQEVPITVPDHR